MGETATVLAFAVDLFSGMGPVEARRMFGGAGLYAGGLMFALVDEGRIYLKTDAAMQADLAAAGASAWIYTERRGPKAGASQKEVSPARANRAAAPSAHTAANSSNWLFWIVSGRRRLGKLRLSG